jgi:hypothetical protein
MVRVRLASRPCPAGVAEAAERLLKVYTVLARRGDHLLATLMAGQAPREWAHYPEDDAICRSGGFQWFYHSHCPADRADSVEHGHIHLFARRPLWGRRLQSRSEKDFARLCGNPDFNPNTRHLLAIGFNAKGMPVSLFTVNSWVTGDLMLSAKLTLELLSSLQLMSGHPAVDEVIEMVVRLCIPDLTSLMFDRDSTILAYAGTNKLADKRLELLSAMDIDLDARLTSLRAVRRPASGWIQRPEGSWR